MDSTSTESLWEVRCNVQVRIIEKLSGVMALFCSITVCTLIVLAVDPFIMIMPCMSACGKHTTIMNF